MTILLVNAHAVEALLLMAAAANIYIWVCAVNARAIRLLRRHGAGEEAAEAPDEERRRHTVCMAAQHQFKASLFILSEHNARRLACSNSSTRRHH